MDFQQVETLEDVRQYVEEHDNFLALAWLDMLFDVTEFGEEYEVADFLAEAEQAFIRHKL